MFQSRFWVIKLLVVLLAFSLLAGCSGGNNQSKKQQVKNGQETEKPKAEQGKANNQEVEFFNGKTVTIIVATKAGGGYDTYARLVAPYLQKNLPGSTVIVKNVPGAGHIIGANEIYNSAPDGLTFGTFNNGLLTSQLLGLEGINFDLNKMTWIGNGAQEPLVFVVGKKTPYQSLDDIIKSKKSVRMAAAGVGSAAYNEAVILSKILKFEVTLVPGYAGSEADMAIMRGEVDGQIASVAELRKLVDSGEERGIIVIGSKSISGLESVPLIGKVAPPEVKDLVNLMVTQNEISRPYAGPPGIPAERAKVLREAFRKAFNDPDLLAKAKVAKLSIDFMDGAETEKAFKDALAQTPEVIKLLKELVVTDNKSKK